MICSEKEDTGLPNTPRRSDTVMRYALSVYVNAPVLMLVTGRPVQVLLGWKRQIR